MWMKQNKKLAKNQAALASAASGVAYKLKLASRI